MKKSICILFTFIILISFSFADKSYFYENGKVITDQTKIAKSDKSSNIKTCRDAAFADRLIRNTYKTLMSRGQKGCYIYCEDEELRNYFKKVFVSSNLIKNDF